MGILTRLQDDSNFNIVSKTIRFFDRFIPKERLLRCGFKKPADLNAKDMHCYRQSSLFDEKDSADNPGSVKPSFEGSKMASVEYSAESILMDKIIIGFWHESYNQSRDQQGMYGITGRYSHNTWYRFDRSHVNWERLQLETAADIISYFQESMPITVCSNGKPYKGSLAIDDSVFKRTLGVHGGKTTDRVSELLGKVFDHNAGHSILGYRMETALWTNGVYDVPVGQVLLASRDEKLRYGPVKQFDGRSLEGKRRKRALTKGTDIMVYLAIQTKAAGIEFDEVLTDKWFSNPAQAIDLLKHGIHLIAMAKKGNAKYGVLPEDSKVSLKKVKPGDLIWLDSKEIYSQAKKRRGTSKYLFSIQVWIKDKEKDDTLYPVKLVYARNHNDPKDWVVFLCTNLDLSEEDVLIRYTHRWPIEVYFKIAKHCLGLRDCHSTSYDALTGYTTIVALRYMMLSTERFDARIIRMIEKLFTDYQRTIRNQIVQETCLQFGDRLIDSFTKVLKPSDAQLKAIIIDFIDELPESMRIFFDMEKVNHWI